MWLLIPDGVKVILTCLIPALQSQDIDSNIQYRLFLCHSDTMATHFNNTYKPHHGHQRNWSWRFWRLKVFIPRISRTLVNESLGLTFNWECFHKKHSEIVFISYGIYSKTTKILLDPSNWKEYKEYCVVTRNDQPTFRRTSAITMPTHRRLTSRGNVWLTLDCARKHTIILLFSTNM